MNTFFKKRDHILPNQRLNRVVTVAGLLSLAVYVVVQFFSPKRPLPYAEQMIHAARLMEQAIAIIGSYYDQSGIIIDETIDPNRTGLLGPENSELTTTLGHLEAKRTTTNPNMAGLIVHLLYQAGVTAGDTIAVGCSASFPALMIATLAAAKAMQVYPVVILSLGASSYGGTNVDFDLLDVYQLFLKEGIFTVPPAAISLGGEKDIGQDFKPDIKERLMKQIQQTGIPFIYEPDLQKNVAIRMKIYQGNSSSGRISAFVNIGGSYGNLGTSELALELKPGLNRKVSIPPKPERGVLFEMAAQNIPCLHLLFIKGLAMKYGLPWDPIPLPKPGKLQLQK
ncbi:MAG: poly-gamma-glutamate system protein [candidate division KSB1 bacterium]|nr:poly-gamma-glutamate system protein [candidate division KSB1 bacterium]MDZ7300610.1 poly-gamma-glutamate system protein [candidate division KSB1 bacterium]MDZ7309747.1 poly-gamma-glutamate system protein [candidate division KSB1 bacterium]